MGKIFTYDVETPEGETVHLRSVTPLSDDAIYKHVAAERLKSANSYADPTAGMSGYDKVVTNFGAGMASTARGAGQLLQKIPGVPQLVSDEDVTEARARDETLAQATTGGRALQIAGEVAPTLLIPAGRAVQGVAALPKAGRFLARALGSGTARAVGQGAVAGGAAGALQPVTANESRVVNTAIGATVGAALPGALAGVRQGYRYLTRPGTVERATEKIIGATGGEQAAAQAAGTISAAPAGAMTQDIPMKFSQAAQSPQAARLELAQRGTDPDLWVAHEVQQNQRLYEAAQKATRSAPEVASRETARDATTAPMRQAALQAAGQGGDFVSPVQESVERIIAEYPPSSPAHKVAQLVLKDLGGEGLTPSRLYETRKVLAQKLEGPLQLGDDVAATIKGARRETVQIMKAIDQGLDDASGGQWTPYLQEYTQHSRGVGSARTQQEIREAIEPVGGPVVGASPQVTRSILKRALGTGGERMEDLSPEARARVQEVIDAAIRIEEPMRTLKLAGTGGGGSQTAMQQAAMKAANVAASVVPHGAVQVAKAVGKKSADVLDREVNRLLLDPAQAAAQINAKLARNLPLSDAEVAVAMLMRTTGAGLGVPAQPQQPQRR